jgi:5'-3' exonuclease
MNGVIHEAAQKVYEYGKYSNEISIPDRLRKFPKKTIGDRVKSEVNRILRISKPCKSVYLAIDGVAPKSKQNQQRQRRFRAARESSSFTIFDSSCITAGTEFMKELARDLIPLNWIQEIDSTKIILSDDSVPGEGEHKLMDWVRKHPNERDSFCVVGMDADLILLCALCSKENVYIMRERLDRRFDFIFVKDFKERLSPTKPDDLLVWSCLVGNDFLPSIPSLEIKESRPEPGALDFFLSNQQKRLVNPKTYSLNFAEITRLLKLVEDREQAIMEARKCSETSKLEFDKRFPNPMWDGDVEKYRKLYHEKKLKSADAKSLVHDYMKTVQWVYIYYSRGIPSWDWFYPHNYALHADDFVRYMPDVPRFGFRQSTPCHPHEQLLRVLPNKKFVPKYLHEKMDEILEKYQTFEIDKSWKRQDWEAVVIVDFVDVQGVSFV